MAITSFTYTPVGPDAWELRFASDLADPTFYVYRDGDLIATQQPDRMLVRVFDGSSVFEVFDDAATEPLYAFPQYITLQWYGDQATATYRIDKQNTDLTWSEVRTITDLGQRYFPYATETLSDDTTHTYRVVPIGTNGNEGTSRTFAVLMARIPDPPSVSMAYSAGTAQVTISAA